MFTNLPWISHEHHTALGGGNIGRGTWEKGQVEGEEEEKGGGKGREEGRQRHLKQNLLHEKVKFNGSISKKWENVFPYPPGFSSTGCPN